MMYYSTRDVTSQVETGHDAILAVARELSASGRLTVLIGRFVEKTVEKEAGKAKIVHKNEDELTKIALSPLSSKRTD